MYTLFICGAPHNSKGFEYTIINGSPLPDNIGQYIDIYDSDKMKDGRSYVIQKLKINKIEYTLIAEFIRINPSDQKTSRGSYIAVGVLTDETVSLHEAIGYLNVVSSIQAYLQAFRNSRNAFSVDFNMEKVPEEIYHDYSHIAFLANMAKDISHLDVNKKIIFNNYKHKDKIENISDDSIENELKQLRHQLKQLKQRVELYEQELVDEKRAHSISVAKFEDKIAFLEKSIDSLNEQNMSLRNVNDKLLEPRRSRETGEVQNKSTTRQYYEPKNIKKRRRSSRKAPDLSFGEKKSSPFLKMALWSAIIILLGVAAYIGYGYVNALNYNADTAYKIEEEVTSEKKIITQEPDEKIDIDTTPEIAQVEELSTLKEVNASQNENEIISNNKQKENRGNVKERRKAIGE